MSLVSRILLNFNNDRNNMDSMDDDEDKTDIQCRVNVACSHHHQSSGTRTIFTNCFCSILRLKRYVDSHHHQDHHDDPLPSLNASCNSTSHCNGCYCYMTTPTANTTNNKQHKKRYHLSTTKTTNRKRRKNIGAHLSCSSSSSNSCVNSAGCQNILLIAVSIMFGGPIWKHISTMSLFFILQILLLFFNSTTVTCFDGFQNDLEQTQTSLCGKMGVSAVGMESNVIRDSALSASSSFSEQVGPQNARLNRELSGGAWCPATQIDQNNSGHEWIQINLTEPYVITKIATQGRFGNGMGVEYAEVIWIDYTRDGIKWNRWRNQYGDYDIQGNVDTYSIVENVLPIPLVGVTAIRVLPISPYTRTCCLRFELYGCPYKDGPISYSMIDGIQHGSRFGILIDDTYDGYHSEDGFLTQGLGQLTDGIKGDDNYKVNNGFEWIGWSAAQPNTQPLSITFHFADIRNFSQAKFYCHNLFTEHIQTFQSAKIWFSLDGHKWLPEPEDFAYMPDRALTNARDVTIHLHHRIGRFIRFDLQFASKWLLISEVSFESTAIEGGLSINELDYGDMIKPIITTTTALQAITNTKTLNTGTATATTSTARSIYNEPIVFVIFASIGLLLILFVAMLLWMARKRKEKITGSEYTSVSLKEVSPTTPIPLYCEPNDFNGGGVLIPPFVAHSNPVGSDPEYAVPDLIGNNHQNHGRTPFNLNHHHQLNLIQHAVANSNNKSVNGSTLLNRIQFQRPPSSATTFAGINRAVGGNNWTLMVNNDNQDDNGKLAKYYASTDVLLRNQHPSAAVAVPLMQYNNNLGVGAFPLSSNNFFNASLVPNDGPTPQSSLSSNGSKSKANNANNSSTHSTSLESNNNNTPVYTTKTPSPILSTIPQLKEKEVSIIDGHFGYSKFGDCELGYLKSSKNDDQNQQRLVILKTLNNNNLRDEFMQQMNEKWHLSNKCPDTFAKIYGYICKYDYLAMIIEYGDIDLKKFLKNSSPSVIGFHEQLNIACQIAEAMTELHARGFIHRDLAARNCLVYTSNQQLLVKITDSGALMNAYKNEYFNKLFPIRWMSYESIRQGVYSNKTDVFSFGVTLWEIMKYCQTLPHHPLTDEEILSEIYNDDHYKEEDAEENSSAYYNHPFSDTTRPNNCHERTVLRLLKPNDCPDDMYDLIVECTKRHVDSRPEFQEIVYFLMKKKSLAGHRKL